MFCYAINSLICFNLNILRVLNNFDEGVLTSISGNSAQDLQQQGDLNQSSTLSKEDAKNQIFNLYGNDLKFVEEPEIEEVVYVNTSYKVKFMLWIF